MIESIGMDWGRLIESIEIDSGSFFESIWLDSNNYNILFIVLNMEKALQKGHLIEGMLI